ncbi:HAD family hydrolase [Paradesertivirga mongoliensis]|uniref:HAD family hydrolase n=1 Tax=Paradesertivirga mongoliensis TaxID=2100740 RepID=A0ABW4ZFV6_9SPHI|nr:HAD family phosphatase [Pedobacter mongoliensis]
MAKAFLFDLNGTMIDDMDYHTNAWQDVLNNDLGASLTWQQVKMEMYGKGEEMLVRVFGEDRFADEKEMSNIVFEKEKKYQQAFRPHLKLINGLEKFIEKADERDIKMAVGSAAIMFNIDFVLDGLNIRKYFPVTISADNVEMSKPDPETFLKGAAALGVDPQDCIVFEDNPKGVQSALNAGMKAVVITTMHEEHEFEGLPNILKFIEDYDDPFLESLLV